MTKKLIKSNILNLLLCLVVATLPLKSNFNSMSIILLLLYSIFFIYSKRKEIVFKPSKEVLILILPFIFILTQGFYSEWNSFSKNTIRSLPLIIFPLFFFYLKPWFKITTSKAVLKTLVFSAIGYSLFLLIVAFYRQIQYKPDFSTVNWYFFTYYDFTEALDIHPTYLGMYLCLSFAVVLNEFLGTGKKAFKNILLLSFLGLIVFLSGSRIALVCLILIILSLLFFKINILNKKKKATILLLIIVFPVLIFNLVPIVKERMIDMTFGLKNTYKYAKYGNEGKDNNYNGGLTPRFLIWSCAIDVGNRNHFFGSGFGKTQKLLNACYLSKNLETFAEQNYQTHNQYFNNYARGGFVGLFVLLTLYFYSLVFSLKRKQILHLSFLIIIIVASLTENILNRHFGIVFFAFFNSLFFFSSNKRLRMKYEILLKSFKDLKKNCEEESFQGWDPYDGLNSWVIQKTLLGKSRFFRLAWIQLFKRNPINLRPLFGIKKDYNPKGLGLFLTGYCNLYKIEPSEEYLDKINFLANKILELKTSGYSGACWGYNFDWQARAFFQPKYTPTVVATSFIGEALIDAYEITKRDELLQTAISCTSFVLKDLNKSLDEDKDFTFSYSPLDNTQVYNAGLLGAKLLALVYPYNKDANLLGTAKQVVSYVCKRQTEEGAWSYGTLPFHQWVDNFHTGYNLECIYKYQEISGDLSFQKYIDKGLDYYLKTFFTQDGLSKYYNDKTYPIDIHAPAQLIVTLSKLGVLNKNKELVDRVLLWTIKNMQSTKGFFYYQKKKWVTSKIPYIRWAQSWMFYALSYYILEFKSNEQNSNTQY